MVNGLLMASFELRSVAVFSSNRSNDPSSPIIAHPDDTQFDHENSPQLEVKRATTVHFLIRAKIDGHAGGWFILDTGASASTISRGMAARLQLEQV